MQASKVITIMIITILVLLRLALMYIAVPVGLSVVLGWFGVDLSFWQCVFTMWVVYVIAALVNHRG